MNGMSGVGGGEGEDVFQWTRLDAEGEGDMRSGTSSQAVNVSEEEEENQEEPGNLTSQSQSSQISPHQLLPLPKKMRLYTPDQETDVEISSAPASMSFTAYMSDTSLEIPEISDPDINLTLTTTTNGNGNENKRPSEELRSKDKLEDEELKREIERKLNRSLFQDAHGDEEEVRARRIRCSDGSLRGQYEECTSDIEESEIMYMLGNEYFVSY